MSAQPQLPAFADAEAFLAWEARQDQRHELVDGEVYAMTGASLTHNSIAGNAFAWLRQALRGGPCRVFIEGAKLHIEAAGAFVYPDVAVTCDPRDRQPAGDRFIAHPWLAVEVLSDSTAAYDRGRKFELYRQLDTLTHYLLIEQDRPYADLFVRNPQGQWVLHPLTAPDSIALPGIATPWPVASLFEGVVFPDRVPAGPQATDDPARPAAP